MNKKTTKILFISLTTFSRTGGIEKFNKSFLKSLSEIEVKKAIEAKAVSLYDRDSDEDYFLKNNYKGYSGNKLFFILGSIFKSLRSDVIVLGHINVSIIGYFIKLIAPKKKIFLIAHGVEVWKPLNKVKRNVLDKADCILTVSNFTKEKLVAVHHIDQEKIKIFHNTIDPFFTIPSTFSLNTSLRKKYGLTENDFVLFTLTRLSSDEKYKGYDTVINSLPQLLKNIPTLKYVIGGKSDLNEQQRLTKLVTDLNLESVVFFIGFVKDEEVKEHYQMADLFIMPSKGEGFGIVFIESMVCGLPVIAGNKDGSVDAVVNGELGMLVDPNNIQDIVEKVLESYDSRLLWKQDAQLRLQQKTLQHFGFNKYKAKLETLISQ